MASNSLGSALVVLGCPPARYAGERPGGERRGRTRGKARALEGAFHRRVVRAAREWSRVENAHGEGPDEDRPSILIASGGRSWGGVVEADAMAEALVALGVPVDVIVRERASLTTRDNARYSA